MGVEGNEKAEEAAKAVGERLTSLVHINCVITETKWKEAKKWLKRRHEARPYTQRALYYLSLNTQGPDTGSLSEDASITRRYFQLKFGHAVMDTFLKRIGKRDSDKFWDCLSQTKMNVHHMIYHCQTWRGEEWKIMVMYKKEIVSTLVMVKQLFGLRKATVAVLEFIATTGAGRQPRQQEEMKESDKRDIAEELNDEQMEGDGEEGEKERQAGDRGGVLTELFGENRSSVRLPRYRE